MDELSYLGTGFAFVIFGLGCLLVMNTLVCQKWHFTSLAV